MVEVSGSRSGGLTLRPFGQLCHFQLGPLRTAFDGALECATDEIRVDLSGVTLLSSSAVVFFEAAAIECELRGLRFSVVQATGLNRTVLELLGASQLLDQRPRRRTGATV